MDPLTLGAGIGGANLLGGLLGGLFGSGDRSQALQMQQDALQNILNTNSPNLSDLKVALNNYDVAGQLSPQMQQVISQDPSAMAGIQEDPRLKAAQMQALGKLQQYGATGLRPEDLASLYQINQQTEQGEQAREQSILQDMQQRGMAGSGAELAQKLASSQGAANRQASNGMNVGAIASQNALQSILNAGNLGGQIRGQDFNQQAQQASAQDVINRYNAMNRQNVLNQNVGLTNAAQAQNLNNKQNVMNLNTQNHNQQEMYNKYLPELQFQNQMNKNIAAGNVTGQAAQGLNNQADRIGNIFGKAGNAIGQGIGAGAAYGENQDYMNILKGKYSSTPSLDSDVGSMQMPQSTLPFSVR